ncbi:anthranilate synthase component I [Altererythrobacter aurantiacus]|uniref:Anthranilate synthase component 1 n=1 Tax=Parapontixanthobacter aurantiacus TaxID=1463599 RepID=A0A844ZC55_9SPHN|nr:anthranilate synthase component I [Parapontixanthobacter aurantiacus]MXO85368.1 anthranilate synthase component I [Parapontixanthobacter aurantiacus]
MTSTQGAETAAALLEAGKPALVWRKVVADTVTPVRAAVHLVQPGRGDFLLESVEGGETRGRFSLLGLDPDLVFRVDGKAAFVNRNWQTDQEAFEKIATPAVEALRDLHRKCQIDTPEEIPGALSCLVGYFSFETIGLIERIDFASADPLDLPDMLFVRPTTIFIFDRLQDCIFCVAPIWNAAQEPGQAIAAASERIDTLLAKLAASVDKTAEIASARSPRPEPAMDEADYRAMVGKAKNYIEQGEIFQVVLAQRFFAPFDLPPLALYRALRRINPSPFLFFLDFPDFAIVGSSPEILVRVREGEVTVRPIAGTRPRGATADADRKAEEELLADPKELAEHLMLLDLGRNDVGRVARSDTVKVTQSYFVERYSHVMHIVSNVVGRLDPAKDALDALFAGFPAGTVSGAPKIRACEIIAKLEPERRGPYAGGVGYFGTDGTIDSCIVLRTAIVKDEVMHVYAGAGIVADSDPEYELRECRAKAGALFAAAEEAVRLSNEPGFGQ